MSGEGPIAHAPRHLTPSERRSRHLRRPGAIGAAAHLKPMATLALEAEDAAVPSRERVHRRHLALALAVTLFCLPVLALDNLPATAETNEAQVAAAPAVRDEPTTTLGEITAPSPPAPTTTVAPATSVPPTPAPPTPTTEPRVSAVAAPAPPPAPTTTAPPPPAPPPPARHPTGTPAIPRPGSVSRSARAAGTGR